MRFRQTTCTLNAYGLVQQQLHVDSPEMCVYLWRKCMLSSSSSVVFFFKLFICIVTMHRNVPAHSSLALLCLVPYMCVAAVVVGVFFFKSISIVFSIETRFYEIVSIQFGRMRFSSVFNRFFFSFSLFRCVLTFAFKFVVFDFLSVSARKQFFFCSHIHASETKAISNRLRNNAMA